MVNNHSYNGDKPTNFGHCCNLVSIVREEIGDFPDIGWAILAVCMYIYI